MAEDLIDVYEAETLMEARLLCDRLEEAGVKTFIDNVDSPLDGLTLGDQMKIVRVLPESVETARRVIAAFEQEQSDED
jgi:hypothetical protein